MRKELIFLVAVAGLIVAGAVWVSPKATVIAGEGSIEVHGIDILDLTKQAKDLPIQQYPGY